MLTCWVLASDDEDCDVPFLFEPSWLTLPEPDLAFWSWLRLWSVQFEFDDVEVVFALFD